MCLPFTNVFMNKFFKNKIQFNMFKGQGGVIFNFSLGRATSDSGSSPTRLEALKTFYFGDKPHQNVKYMR
jgi:hypothetical protein